VTAAEGYSKQYESYFSKVKDPAFKNNSNGISGVMSGGYAPITGKFCFW
jgi:hypothetical protein